MQADDTVPTVHRPAFFQREGWLPFAPVRIGAGVLLLVAATLKAHQLATIVFPADGWLRIAQVTAEWLLSLWLLAGLFPLILWMAAVACFIVFSGVTTIKIIQLQTTCGCFGELRTDPRLMLGVDLLCLAIVAISRPGTWRRNVDSVRSATGLLVFGLCGAAAAGWAGYKLGAPIRASRAAPVLPELVPLPSGRVNVGAAVDVDAGQFKSGESRVVAITIRNAGMKDAEVRSIRAECDCTQVASLKRIPARGEATLWVNFSPRESGHYVVIVNCIGAEPTVVRLLAKVDK